MRWMSRMKRHIGPRGGQVTINSSLVKLRRISFNNFQRIHRAVTDARTETIAIHITDKFRFTVDQLDSAFRTGVDALSAAVAFLFIDFDDFPDHSVHPLCGTMSRNFFCCM